MNEADTLAGVLGRCRFLRDERELDATLPGVREALPPLQSVEFRDTSRPSMPAYPVVPSPPLIEQLTEYVATEVRRLQGGGAAQAVSADAEDLQNEPYSKSLTELLAKTRAHGTIFRLDSVLWIHLTRVVAYLLNPDPALRNRMRRLSPGVRDSWITEIEECCGQATDKDLEVIQTRRGVLRALASRHELANLTISQMVGDSRPNALHSAMVANRLVLALPPGFLAELDLRPLMQVKNYGVSPKTAEELLGATRAVIEDLYLHRSERALSGTERFFVTQFFDEATLSHVRGLDPGLFAGHGDVDLDDAEASFRFRLGWSLAFDDQVLRYLLAQMEQFNVRRALKGQLHRYSKAFLGELDAPNTLRRDEERILELAGDIRALDLFSALHGLQVDVEENRGGYSLEGQELRAASAPLDLGSYYELFRRNRAGTAVFIDLIGFTAKTRELFFSTTRGSVAGDVELHERGELAALALERLFTVRKELGAFDGRPEGFEGDAILDILPDALSALRYVARFKENFAANRRVRFRPFSRPVANPFAQEGFRVGIATGDYTQVNVPDRDDSGAAIVRLRSIGPTINRASRLNSGKRGGETFLTTRADEAKPEENDPLGIHEVSVTDEVLNNTGFCVDRATFNELKEMVRRERLPHWLPGTDPRLEIGGRSAVPAFYRFDLLVRDPETDFVFALRRLGQVPKLKGIERSESVVYEALLYTEPEYLDFLRKDEKVAARTPAATSSVTGSWEAPPPPVEEAPSEHLAAELPDYMYERSHGRIPVVGGTQPKETETPAGAFAPPDPPEPPEPPAPPPEPTPAESMGLPPESPIPRTLGDDLDAGPPAPAPLEPVSDDGGGLDSSLEQWALGGDGAPLAASTDDGGPAAQGQGEEDLDDEELQAYLTDFLNKFEGMEEEEESGEESGPGGDEALFVPFASDVPSADPDGGAEAEDEPVMPAPEPAFEPREETVLSTPPPPATPAPFSAVPAEPSEDSLTSETSMPDWSAPAPSQAWDTETEVDDSPPFAPPAPPPVPEGPDSLLGALGDDVAERIRELSAPPPVVEPEPVRRERAVAPTEGLAEETSLSPPDLEQLLSDYYVVVRPEGGDNEIWIGRLFRDKLFDLHRYRMPPAAGGGVDLDAVIERFLREKIDENFLTFGSRFDAVPADGSDPVPLPLDLAERILMGLL